MDEVESIAANVPVPALDRVTSPAPERVTLGKLEAERIAAWLAQIGEASNGLLTLSKADLVNFIIREHRTELSSRELSQIRRAHYDPIRHMDWITKALKTAIAASDTTMIAKLQAEIRGIQLSVIETCAKQTSLANAPTVPKPRRKSKGKNLNPSTKQEIDIPLYFEDSQKDFPEG
jgi:hypothetical protein